jgi:DNA-binding NarL/FixJ family response regulator
MLHLEHLQNLVLELRGLQEQERATQSKIAVVFEKIHQLTGSYDSRPGPRELQVLGLVIKGATNKEISTALNISERTAKFHVSNLLQRYQVSNRQSLAMAAAIGRTENETLSPQVVRPVLVHSAACRSPQRYRFR